MQPAMTSGSLRSSLPARVRPLEDPHSPVTGPGPLLSDGVAGAGAARRILIIDHETGMAQQLRQNLELDGHEVMVERDVGSGVAQARTFLPHLVIIDLAVIEEAQYLLLEQLRKDHESLPVLVLAQRPEEATRLSGFRLGVDDFLVFPVGVTELHRRIDTLLGHPSAPPRSAPSPVRFGEVEVHPASRTVLRAGAPVSLRLKEFELLMALIGRGGGIATRVDLLREVWGYRTWVATRTVDTHVAELRRKLEQDPANPRYILTVRKVGYRFER
ncbi:MAG: response regulator transcription factor [Gemmatimonadota bacterium]